MNAIREIRKVKNNQIIITLPSDFTEKEVEVIIMPISVGEKNRENSNKNDIQTKKQSGSLAGIFKNYARPELIDKEIQIAWEKKLNEDNGLY